MLNSLYGLVTMFIVRLRSDEGQTMAEYGILIGVIALVVVLGAVFLGGDIKNLFSNAGGQL